MNTRNQCTSARNVSSHYTHTHDALQFDVANKHVSIVYEARRSMSQVASIATHRLVAHLDLIAVAAVVAAATATTAAAAATERHTRDTAQPFTQYDYPEAARVVTQTRPRTHTMPLARLDCEARCRRGRRPRQPRRPQSFARVNCRILSASARRTQSASGDLERPAASTQSWRALTRLRPANGCVMMARVNERADERRRVEGLRAVVEQSIDKFVKLRSSVSMATTTTTTTTPSEAAV